MEFWSSYSVCTVRGRLTISLGWWDFQDENNRFEIVCCKPNTSELHFIHYFMIKCNKNLISRNQVLSSQHEVLKFNRLIQSMPYFCTIRSNITRMHYILLVLIKMYTIPNSFPSKMVLYVIWSRNNKLIFLPSARPYSFEIALIVRESHAANLHSLHYRRLLHSNTVRLAVVSLVMLLRRKLLLLQHHVCAKVPENNAKKNSCLLIFCGWLSFGKTKLPQQLGLPEFNIIKLTQVKSLKCKVDLLYTM